MKHNATTRTSPRSPRLEPPDGSRPTFDPALTGLAWALAVGPGRIPFLP
jgi:hypothetical protein